MQGTCLGALERGKSALVHTGFVDRTVSHRNLRLVKHHISCL